MRFAVDTLQSIKRSLFEIEQSTEEYNYPGGATDLLRKLSQPLKARRSRIKFFADISSNLNDIVKQHATLSAPAMELLDKATKTEYMLDLVINNRNIPPEETDATIRYVVEDERLRVSPLVSDALLHQAVYGKDLDLEVRRLAWLSICRQRAQGQLPVTGSPVALRQFSSPSHTRGNKTEIYGGEKLMSLHEEILRGRSILGPRGTVLKSADKDSSRARLGADLLKALANPGDLSRNEIALVLGEIGGAEVAAF
jgi:hypothetical protein